MEITDFCEKVNVQKTIERILYHKYQEDMNELVQSYRDENNNEEPPQDTIVGFKQSLLSENTLSSNLRLAEEEIESILKEEIKAEKKKMGRVKFWISVGASVVGSFIFIGILIITFAVANNQIKNLLGVESYGDQDRTTEIESTNDDQN